MYTRESRAAPYHAHQSQADARASVSLSGSRAAPAKPVPLERAPFRANPRPDGGRARDLARVMALSRERRHVEPYDADRGLLVASRRALPSVDSIYPNRAFGENYIECLSLHSHHFNLAFIGTRLQVRRNQPNQFIRKRKAEL